jgi:hypothetical protein
VFLGYNLVSWSAQKQSTVSRLSTEVEYKVVPNMTTETMLIKILLREHGIKSPQAAKLYGVITVIPPNDNNGFGGVTTLQDPNKTKAIGIYP